MQDRMLFLISAPRSGSTLLQRMLGSHSEISTHPEPHLITPLAYLGYHDTVDAAPYDHINAAEAIRLFVEGLPNKEEDYLEALRAYASTMYEKALEPTKKRYFLDKTPAYGLVLPFLAKLYPRAKFVVLTRHPLAIFSSYANSFYNGDWEAAYAFNPVVERYVGAIGRFLRERPVPLLHVKYEQLVEQPERQLERIFAFLDLEHQPEAVNYGERFQGKAEGMGDPIGVQAASRPVTSSKEKWAAELASDPAKLQMARGMIEGCAPEELALWGYSPEQIFEPMEGVEGKEAPVPKLNRYTFQRRVLLALRKDIHDRPHGKIVKKIRYYCDVLLRDSLR